MYVTWFYAYMNERKSRYSNNEAFDDLSLDLIELCDSLPICLTGDFNTGAGLLFDF